MLLLINQNGVKTQLNFLKGDISIMEKQKYLPAWRSLAILLSPALVIFSSLPVGLRAQPYPEWKVSLQFPVEQGIGQPGGGAIGGATRGSCSKKNQQNQMPLTGLMPIRNELNKRIRVPANQTLTVAANPTFFVYVPETTAKSVEFLLFNEQDQVNEVYQTTLQLPTAPSSSVSTPGIVKLSLPANVSLKTGKNYRWVFALNCIAPDGDLSENLYVEGWIQRTELSPDLKTKVEQATLLEQAKLYATARIWPETLVLASQLRSSKPDEWEELLNSVGLTEIAQAPFIEYPTPEQ
jgi:hypothetical protein